jgi:uncharacterized membrane protein YcaP (DUF421 family)
MGVDDVLFDQWSTLARVLVVGSLAYVGLVLVLRLSGKRTLAKLNAFDLVVTVALGSTLATVVLSSDVTLAAGIVAIALLVLLQYVVAWVASRSRTLRRVVKSEPTLLLHRGTLIHDRLRRNRVTAGEVRQAVRSQGIGGLDAVHAVVLETDGTLSVIPTRSAGTGNALDDVDLPAHSRRNSP